MLAKLSPIARATPTFLALKIIPAGCGLRSGVHQKLLEFTRGDCSEDQAVKAEAEKHLPENMSVFKQMAFFRHGCILSSNPPKFAAMPFIECVSSSEDLSEVEEEWQQISQVNFFDYDQEKSCKTIYRTMLYGI